MRLEATNKNVRGGGVKLAPPLPGRVNCHLLVGYAVVMCPEAGVLVFGGGADGQVVWHPGHCAVLLGGGDHGLYKYNISVL